LSNCRSLSLQKVDILSLMKVAYKKFAKSEFRFRKDSLTFNYSQDFISMFSFNLSSSFMPFILLIGIIKLFCYIKCGNTTFYSHSDWRKYFQWF